MSSSSSSSRVTPIGSDDVARMSKNLDRAARLIINETNYTTRIPPDKNCFVEKIIGSALVRSIPKLLISIAFGGVVCLMLHFIPPLSPGALTEVVNYVNGTILLIIIIITTEHIINLRTEHNRVIQLYEAATSFASRILNLYLGEVKTQLSMLSCNKTTTAAGEDDDEDVKSDNCNAIEVSILRQWYLARITPLACLQSLKEPPIQNQNNNNNKNNNNNRRQNEEYHVTAPVVTGLVRDATYARMIGESSGKFQLITLIDNLTCDNVHETEVLTKVGRTFMPYLHSTSVEMARNISDINSYKLIGTTPPLETVMMAAYWLWAILLPITLWELIGWYVLLVYIGVAWVVLAAIEAGNMLDDSFHYYRDRFYINYNAERLAWTVVKHIDQMFLLWTSNLRRTAATEAEMFIGKSVSSTSSSGIGQAFRNLNRPKDYSTTAVNSSDSDVNDV